MTARHTLDKHMSEAALQAAVIECAARLGWRVYHPYDSRRSEAGFPDLTMVRHGVLIFAELKADGGRLRPKQKDWLAALEWVGLRNPHVHRYVWYPDDWSSGAIEAVLKGERA